MGRSYFWEKLGDLRFREIENRIFKGFFEEGLRTSTEIARFVKVSRSTVFRHHQTVFEIRTDYIDYILYRFREEVVKEKATKDYRRLFYYVLIFIVRYQKVFRGLFQDGAEELIIRMMEEIKFCIEKEFLGLRNERVYKVLNYEVYAILEEWIRKELPSEEMNLVFEWLVYLVKSAEERLMGLK